MDMEKIQLQNKIAQLEREASERANMEQKAKEAQESHLEKLLKQTLDRVAQLEKKEDEPPKESEVPEKVVSKPARMDQGTSHAPRPAESDDDNMSSSDEEGEEDHIVTPTGERVPLTTLLKPQPCIYIYIQ